MKKIPKPGSEFSPEREFTAILEDLRSQFRVFGERLQYVQNKLEKMDERLTRLEDDMAQVKCQLTQVDMRLMRLEEDVAGIKSAFVPFTRQVSNHEHRITGHEKRLTAVEARSAA